jgi:hypothetical protein
LELVRLAIPRRVYTQSHMAISSPMPPRCCVTLRQNSSRFNSHLKDYFVSRFTGSLSEKNASYKNRF